VTPLVHPSFAFGKFGESGQSIGNKCSNVLRDPLWQRIEHVAPHAKALTPFDEHRVEKVHAARMYRLHRHEVQHPFSTLEREVHAVDDERVRPRRKVRGRRGDEETQRMLEASCDTAACECSEVSGLLFERVTLKEDAREQCVRGAPRLRAASFPPDAPGAFASCTLSSPLAETLHPSIATGRFRMLWCYTRELCGITTKLSRKRGTKQKRHQPN